MLRSAVLVVIVSRLKVTENGIIRYIAYEFLFVSHSNYGYILYRFRDKARYRPTPSI